jgi:hypothetical protein
MTLRYNDEIGREAAHFVEVRDLAGEHARLATLIPKFSLGWNAQKLSLRLYEIHRFFLFNSELVIPLARRRKISRLARDLLSELDGLGGLAACRA